MESFRVPKEHSTYPQRGDIVLVKNRTFISYIIRIGEWLRFHKDTWSHVAIAVDDEGGLIEALWSGVKETHISKYENVTYMIVKTGTTILGDDRDWGQALAYLRSQLNKEYGFLTLIGTATRFFIPGHNFMFISSHNICSGLAAQALTRGSFIGTVQPVTMSPTELAENLGVETS